MKDVLGVIGLKPIREFVKTNRESLIAMAQWLALFVILILFIYVVSRLKIVIG